MSLLICYTKANIRKRTKKIVKYTYPDMIREISEALTDSFHDGEHPDQYLRDLLNKKIGENPIEEMTPKLLKLIVH